MKMQPCWLSIIAQTKSRLKYSFVRFVMAD